MGRKKAKGEGMDFYLILPFLPFLSFACMLDDLVLILEVNAAFCAVKSNF